MYRKTRILATVSLFVFALGFSSNAVAHCSEATLHGSYGLHATGVNAAGSVASVGRFTFDGKGNLTGTLYLRVATGANIVLDITGTYSVTPECIVTDTWNFTGGSSTHTSVIVHSGDGYFILNTTTGETSVISGEAQRQRLSIRDIDND